MTDGSPQSDPRSASATQVMPNLPDRPYRCPECDLPLAGPERAQHLVAVHDYVVISGSLLPRPAAVACLWDRVFTMGDAQAQDRLRGLLAGPVSEGSDSAGYLAALENEILQRVDDSVLARPREWNRVIEHLRQSGLASPVLVSLLNSERARVRQVVRELLLQEAVEEWKRGPASVEQVRQRIETLCAREDVWTKIRLCQRLGALGVSPDALRECLAQLQAERPVACPQCGQAVPGQLLTMHLRQAHQIYEFRGVRRSLGDTARVLVEAIVQPRVDLEAWAALEGLARDEYADRADRFLAGVLSQALAEVPAGRRASCLNAMAETIFGSSWAAELALRLALARDSHARQLALALGARLPPPLPRPLLRALRQLLVRRRAPNDLQIAAAAALLQTTGSTGTPAEKIINALITRCSKTRALERLRQLQAIAGNVPVIGDQYVSLENQIRMRCPRCAVELVRPEMAHHLWNAHMLLLDGRRVRKPWQMIRDWIGDYRRQGNAELLERCRRLGQSLDPEHGLERVYRLFLARHVDDVEARQVLLAEARLQRASLCPRCFARVPVRSEPAVRPLNQSHGRLSLGEYVVEVSERGLRPQLYVAKPGKEIYRGVEPGTGWTLRAWLLILVGPPVLAALACGVLIAWSLLDSSILLLGFLGLAGVLYCAARFALRHTRPPIDRAVDHAWTQLAPGLHAEGYSTSDEEFLAGLATLSKRYGDPMRRLAPLQRIVRCTENAVAEGTPSLGLLAALKHLELANRAASADPLPGLAQELAACWTGKRPLAYAQRLLEEQGGAWRAGQATRLRILLCDQAFEAGLEVLDLLEAGHAAGALGEILGLDDPDGLARLRLLWSLRPRRPWDQWTEARNAFEIAVDSSSEGVFARHPDLLFLDDRPFPVLVCGRGIYFENVLFNQRPRPVDARMFREHDRLHYELRVGEYRFDFDHDPSPISERLERWIQFFFKEFQPELRAVLGWQAPEHRAPLRFEHPVQCPDCHRLVFPTPGAIGVLADSASAAAGKPEREPRLRKKPRRPSF